MYFGLLALNGAPGRPSRGEPEILSSLGGGSAKGRISGAVRSLASGNTSGLFE
jgi:hypothetical protein